jgi:hypothetical protein
MRIRRWQFERVMVAGIQSTALAVTVSCAVVTIRAPEPNEVLRSGSVTLQVQKDDKGCSFRTGSFRAVLNRGLPGEVDLTNMFVRPPNSNTWVVPQYALADGSYTLSAQAEFTGSACGAGRVSSDSRRFNVSAVNGLITYETSCGTGEFTYEPYPVVPPPGAMWPPPSYPIATNAHCVSPGSTVQIGNLRRVYADLASITSLQLAVLHTRWDPERRDAGYQLGVWDRWAAPNYYRISDFRLTANGALVATIPGDITREPPAAASIRMTYADPAGQSHVVDIEADGSGGWQSWGLFFVPSYKVYGARTNVGIGFDLFDRTVDGVALSASIQGGWEEYCRIRYKNLSTTDFPGTVSFREPNAWTRSPTQGYRVRMPAIRTGSFDIIYQVVCPADMVPSGRSQFSGWSLLGDYTLEAGQRMIRGMPPIFMVDSP